MEEMQFSISIHATDAVVWDTLWSDKTFREWAGIIDPGTYMHGELIEGAEVQFISAENGYGVTSLVESVVPYESLVLRHHADTQDAGARERKKEWTGGKESYELVSVNGVTTLTTTFDVPLELKEYFTNAYPKALARVKEIAESK